MMPPRQSSVRFWLWDAWEDAAKRPGQIFLFGKIAAPGKPAGEYVTACIKVEHIDRCLYLLPREYVSIVHSAEIKHIFKYIFF